MRKFVCLFAIAILFQIIGCKEHLVPPIMNALPEEANVSSTEVLDWDAATKDPSFKNLLDELGELNSGVLTLKGAKKKKKLKLNKSKVKKIKFGKNESFTILIDSLDFTSLKFSNLLLSKNDNKNEAFIVNYYPERSWVASQISHIPSTYKGKIALNRINLEDYTLKTIDCMHVVIYGVIPCTGGPDHVHEGNCNCGDGSDCEPPVRYIIDSDVYCYETHEGGESPAYDSNGSNVPEGGVTGGGASSTGDLDSNDEVIITEGILPYDDNNITAKTLVNDLFGIELGTPADIDIEDFELFDPDSEILIEGKNIAYDDKGGFYFIDKDHLIYYRDGMCYVYINNIYGWYEAGTGLNYFISIVENALSQPLNYLLTAFAQMTPIDGLVTVITGESVLGIEENQIVAGGFLLFEILPGGKVLKPVKKIIQNSATKFIARKGDLVIELLVDLAPVIDDKFIKFSSKSVDELAELATKNASERKVMLGKEFYEGTVPYYTRASDEGYKYFRLHQDDWTGLFSLVNKNIGEMWRVNKKFIDDSISRGNEIYLSHNPYDLNIANGFYKDELDYLENVYSATFEKISDNLWKVIMP